MYTLHNLPHHGVLNAFITADKVDDMGNESAGWISPGWSRRELFESRNDVDPVLHETVSDFHAMDREERESALSAVRDYVDFWDQHDQGSTLYASDAETDLNTGDSWRYAVHFHVKHLFEGEYTESGVDVLHDRINGQCVRCGDHASRLAFCIPNPTVIDGD